MTAFWGSGVRGQTRLHSETVQEQTKRVWKWRLRVSRSVAKGLPNVFEALSSIPSDREEKKKELYNYIDKANIGSQDVAAYLSIVSVSPVLRTLPSPLVGHH